MMEKPLILGAVAATATVACIGYYVYQNSVAEEEPLELSLILLKSVMKDPVKDLAHRATVVSWTLYTDLFNKGEEAILYAWRDQGSRRKIYQVDDPTVLTALEPAVERQGFPVATMKKCCPCQECNHNELYSAIAIGPTRASEVAKLLTEDVKLIAKVDPSQDKSDLLNVNKTESEEIQQKIRDQST